MKGSPKMRRTTHGLRCLPYFAIILLSSIFVVACADEPAPIKGGGASSPTPATQDSNFRKLKLPLGVSLEAPKNWWVLDEHYNATIETAVEAGLNLAGVDLPAGKTVTVFRANSMPKTTYAAISVEVADSELDETALRNASSKELEEIADEIKKTLPTWLAINNFELIEFSGVRREFVNKYPALVIEYKRSGIRGPVVVLMTWFHLKDKQVRLNLSYRESEERLWKPIIEYVRQSLSVIEK